MILIFYLLIDDLDLLPANCWSMFLLDPFYLQLLLFPHIFKFLHNKSRKLYLHIKVKYASKILKFEGYFLIVYLQHPLYWTSDQASNFTTYCNIRVRVGQNDVKRNI